MAKKTAPLLPATEYLLLQLGERLRLARLRRRLSAKQVAERAGMSPMTLRSLEHGGSGVTIGAYLAVMQVLGVEKDVDLLAKADPQGRELQDAKLPKRTKTEKRTGTISQAAHTNVLFADMPEKELQPSDDAKDWIAQSGFASADSLASLLASPTGPDYPKPR